MNFRNLFVLTGVLVAICVVTASARTQISTQDREPTQEREPLRWEYAQLQMHGDFILNGKDSVAVKWIEGDKNITPQATTIGILISRISRRSERPTMANLLNAVGANGWELVNVIDHSTDVRSWTFIRQM